MISWIASLLALVSAMFEGGSMIVEKKTLMKEHAMEFSAAMCIVALLLITPLWLFGDVKSLSLEIIGYIALSAFTSAMTILFIAKGLRHLAISLATPFLAFGPLVTAIFALVFLGEHISFLQWFGIMILLIGAYIIQSHPHQGLLDPFKHAFKSKHIKFIFIGILFYSLTGVLDKIILGKIKEGFHLATAGYLSPQLLFKVVASYLPLLFFFMAVYLVILILIFHDGFHGIGRGMKNNVKWLLIVAFLTIGYKAGIITALAIPGVLLSLVIPIKKLSSLFSTIIGGELFHEKHVLRNTMASLIMIAGAILILL